MTTFINWSLWVIAGLYATQAVLYYTHDNSPLALMVACYSLATVALIWSTT